MEIEIWFTNGNNRRIKPEDYPKRSDDKLLITQDEWDTLIIDGEYMPLEEFKTNAVASIKWVR